jgi:hypothetical protein
MKPFGKPFGDRIAPQSCNNLWRFFSESTCDGFDLVKNLIIPPFAFHVAFAEMGRF